MFIRATYITRKYTSIIIHLCLHYTCIILALYLHRHEYTYYLFMTKNRRRERLRNIRLSCRKTDDCNAESDSFEFSVKLLHRDIVGILKQLA